MQKDKFDICYCLPDDSNNYIVPLLLPNNIPKYSWDKSRNTQLRYVYEEFMPEGILSQFIVKMHQNISEENSLQLVWKQGVILKLENTKAEIIEHTNGNEIRIKLQGKNKTGLRAVIIHNINSIISRFPKQPEIKKPCICKVCKEKPDPYFFNYPELIDRKEAGKTTIECRKKTFVDIDKIQEHLCDQDKVVEKIYNGQQELNLKLESHHKEILSELDNKHIDTNRIEQIIKNINTQNELTIIEVGQEIMRHINWAFDKHQVVFNESMQETFAK